MSGIFISYRRDEAGHAAGRLVDHLSRTFSPDQLFFDIDNIEPGLEFKKEISKRVEACDVLLALIGPKWLSTSDDRGARRLDNPNDFVRLEIETALARDIRVVPLLIDGARMPQPEDLPESLRPLLDRQHVELDHERFGSEVEKVIKALSKVVTPTALSKVVTPTKAEWRASLVKRENRYVKLRIETSGERPHWLELYGVGWMDLLSFRER